MRRYLQGTLDFFCGVYAAVNALSITHSLDLSMARAIFQSTMLDLAPHPLLWANLVGNRTDHYWLVRYMSARWLASPRFRLRCEQPFSDCLLPAPEGLDLLQAGMFLPEKEAPGGPRNALQAEDEARRVWLAVANWFSEETAGRGGRTAILRFHRFLPGLEQPVVSHWTTVKTVTNACIELHDASSEKQAVFNINREQLQCENSAKAQIRIVPESLLLLEKSS